MHEIIVESGRPHLPPPHARLPGGHRPVVPAANEETMLHAELEFRLQRIMEQRALHALFQPIVDLDDGRIGAVEGLIRGPSNSPLHSPVNLFRAAALCQRSVEVEHLCRRVTLDSFAALHLPIDLFLNVSPECLLLPHARYGETLGALTELGIDPKRVVIELTEHQPAYDYRLLRKAVGHYRAMGFRIAIDDLGEGFASLRLWSELRPDFVKIDMHFIQGCDTDPVKRQFLRSIQEIARNSGSTVIAEGIETAAELHCVRELGIARGQGYYFARPSAAPPTALPAEQRALFGAAGLPAFDRGPTAATLVRWIDSVGSDVVIEEACQRFDRQPDLHSLPVVDADVPRGIIARHALIDRLAKPFGREIFGRKSCDMFMCTDPLVVDIGTPLQEIGRRIAEADSNHLANGFIVTENGRYRGIGTGQDLMRVITRLQIEAARHANALTGLPGNEPLNRAIDARLAARRHFCAAYVDLDHFKPFNDIYGYALGDRVIRTVGSLLTEHTDPDTDFVGHIGGDDFMILFDSADWEHRCSAILAGFEAAVRDFFSAEHLAAGGYVAEDRKGNPVFTPLVAMSIGVVDVDPAMFSTHHQVSAAGAGAKKQAKKIKGNSLFCERRKAAIPHATGETPAGT